MNVYIGMDVSLQTTHLCFVDQYGTVLHEGCAASDALALDDYFRRHLEHGQIFSVVLETGPLSTAMSHGLIKSGWPVVCIDARHADGVLKAQRSKTDRNDARALPKWRVPAGIQPLI